MTLRREAARGRVQLVDAGVSLDPNMLWFNLSPRAYAGDSRKRWLQSADFRRAISHAVNRHAIVDQVYLGAAVPVFGPVTPGNARWYDAAGIQLGHNPGRAQAMLDRLELIDRNRDGVREDSHGQPVRFSILTHQQDAIRMRTVTAIQEQLRHIGVGVDVVSGDTGTIVERWSQGRYDAIYFGVEATSYDPANNLDFWLSSGSFHLWNAGQPTPATAWERRIDTLMREQVSSLEPDARKRLFVEAQRILAEEQPVLCFAAPRLVAVMSPRVVNATAAPLKPLILWNAERLAVRQ
jgi:peptide/nickel transport system substrate-binding protein